MEYDIPLYVSSLENIFKKLEERQNLLQTYKEAIEAKDLPKIKGLARELCLVGEAFEGLENIVISQINALVSEQGVLTIPDEKLPDIYRQLFSNDPIEGIDVKANVYERLKIDTLKLRDKTMQIVNLEADLIQKICEACPNEDGLIPAAYLPEINPSKAEQNSFERYSEHMKKNVDPNISKSYQ
jgi:hypothetical protein